MGEKIEVYESEKWKIVMLDERLVDFKSGFACSKKNETTTGVWHLRPFNIDLKGNIDFSKKIRIPTDFKENSEDYFLKKKDVLFNNTNSVELVGKSALVTEDLDCTFSNHITRLRVINQDFLEPAWLVLVLRILWQQKYFAINCNKWIGQAGFGKEKISAIQIPLPPLNEQRRIVARIESLLEEIQESRKLIEEMKRDAERVMDAALEEVFGGMTVEKEPLLNVLEGRPRNGWSPRCQNSPPGTPVLKLGAVLNFQYNPEAVKFTTEKTDPEAHYWLQPGDMLISRSNTLDLVGHASIYSGDPFPCIYPDLIMRFRPKTGKTISKFIIYWLRSSIVRSYIRKKASGASSTMKKIAQGHVCEIPFPKISTNHQKKIVAYLDEIAQEVKAIKESIQEDAKGLEQLEQALLEKAFRGEL